MSAEGNLTIRNSRSRLATWVAAIVVLAAVGVAEGQDGTVGTVLDPVAVEEYWTVERMLGAQPVPMPLGVYPGEAAEASDQLAEPRGEPGFAPGWSPGGGPQPTADTAFQIGDGTFAGMTTFGVEPQHGSAPTLPSGAYAPFQRWTWYGNYLAFPTSTVGKLFFTLGGSNFVCSASVIQKDTVATAGHCVSSGNGTFISSASFCPSFCGAACSFGPHPARGCWPAVFASTTALFHNSGATDRDVGCLVLSTTGDTIADNVGDVTGWTGRAWNFDATQPILAAGYPQGAPFLGHHIVTAFSSEWYTVDMTAADGQVSKYIGNDMTGGSSGGPWWLNVAHRVAEYPAIDGSDATDPFQALAGPAINGVNSHKRCSQPGCPSGSLFTQEMGSPEFTSTPGDTNESEDVFATCFANGGT